MRARALSSAAGTRLAPRPPSWSALALAWALLVAAVVAVAVGVHLAFPGWLEDTPAHPLPDDALTVLDIFFNNLVIAVCPAFGGWLAAGHLAAGRRLAAAVFLALPAIVVVRSIATVGAVGGGDLPWFFDAARWWLLEFAAIAVSARTGLFLARHPQARDEHGPPAMRRAVGVVVLALSLGAVVEVFTA